VERDLIQRHNGTVAPARVKDLVEEVLAGAVIDFGGLELFLLGLNGLRIGQVLGVVGVDAGHCADARHSNQDSTEDDDRHHADEQTHYQEALLPTIFLAPSSSPPN
jgi:hypothetical protein